ncbi:MAG TPA: hypothetical protein VMV49_15745 [Candidatus Deferrimicrobium sp.]|nr:hypothetical protein [Candidatus Deferrimicrobium sp.]
MDKKKIIGILLMIFGICVWGFYTYNLLVAGGAIPNFLGIPLLDGFWIIAVPMFLIVTAVVALMVWLGFSTFTTPAPRVTDEELQKLEELERLARAKRMAKNKEADNS